MELKIMINILALMSYLETNLTKMLIRRKKAPLLKAYLWPFN
jgi:hypothetical protein